MNEANSDHRSLSNRSHLHHYLNNGERMMMNDEQEERCIQKGEG